MSVLDYFLFFRYWKNRKMVCLNILKVNYVVVKVADLLIQRR